MVKYRLYLCTDSFMVKDRSLEEVLDQAIEGGVTVLQIREKELSSRLFYEKALWMKEIAHRHSIPFIINDRVDIAMAVDADGVHVGQSDLPVPVIRNLLGKDKIIGVSVDSIEKAKAAQIAEVDYIGVGAVFPTDTKKDVESVIGIEGLREVCKSVSIPIVGIGGVTQENYKEVLEAGADGVAVISAILGKEDIKAAAEGFYQ